MVTRTREDVARQNALNQSENPRQTILGEATQLYNPIDGKPYLTYPSGVQNPNHDLKLTLCPINLEDYKIDYTFSNNKKYELHSNISYVERILTPEQKEEIRIANSPKNTEFMTYQMALGEMSVRDGNVSAGEFIWANKAREKLVEKLVKANVPLTSIDSASGFDSALKSIEWQMSEKVIKDKNAFFW